MFVRGKTVSGLHDPESPEMRGAIQKLFGVAASEVKPLVAKVNQSRAGDSDCGNRRGPPADRGSHARSGGAGGRICHQQRVKVLRIDGKLPFDVGYASRAIRLTLSNYSSDIRLFLVTGSLRKCARRASRKPVRKDRFSTG